MKIVVIGAYGHIGSYLVPKLVKNNNQVIAISRGQHQPYVQDKSWEKVEHVSLDRVKDPKFAQKVAEINADVVVDLISFHIDDTKKIVEALKNTRLSHYLFCSSVWAHGRAEVLPADPNIAKEPLDDYGINKYKSEQYLKDQYRTNGFPATIVMPGQISGPGWTIINPVGNTDLGVFQKIANGDKITLPNFGMETLHHVHADDVAQVFYKAILHRNQALGESFHAVAAESLTLYGYAKAMYRFFGQEPKIDFLPWPQWKELVNDEALTEHSYYHLARSGQYSIENGRKLINYEPKYSTIETVEQAVQSYIDRGLIK
ncbi:NAD-dependent epimerase/dehydratase family protein [Liquorilactobacillus satsumensis]|uniref:NAD-dependent epimerase/dehydratase family protein n=1 Tax=Liquorilactobacillus TaxID=2767888 RepID=UPI0021C3CFB3|nr:NAD-dependent epimerase/dehydratase family protein [Liquorilactobacillus satsumensis]MCP9328706.1 NAD-dependent epimerase/dehydratase family protein [Liquorilactobacillus satsumensis]